MILLDRRSDAQWAADLVSDFPGRWADRLLSAWRSGGHDRQARNLGHLTRCSNIRQAVRAGIAPDANDQQIRDEADASARDMRRRLGWIERQAQHEPGLIDRERCSLLGQVLEARWWLEQRGVGDCWPECASIRGALLRVCCVRWWRRVLRRVHARAVEGVSRGMGLVSKRAGCYASDDAVARRRGQVARNAAALESVTAVNDHGQSCTLAELAAKGTANKEIRRHELMTRIAGFELIARDCSHEAAFFTVTAPARMHAVRTKPGGWAVEPNPSWDGTQPTEAQRHLSKCWARFRAAADRAGLELYGFRIAEPNHDGTPHWHILAFFPATLARGKRAGRPVGWRVLITLLRRYFWRQHNPEERGSRKHRVQIERIDWTRGSAAGYVAKYVSKNIDGYRVERDLYGNEAMHASQRVEAWAATWRIRQFQQIGGAPVTVWRELRRLHPEQAAAGEAIAASLEAVNVTAMADRANSEAVQRHTAANGWATYLELQGGHRVPRRLQRLRLLREEASGELGTYGELKAPAVVGVVTAEARSEWVPMALHPRGGFRRTWTDRVEVESERAQWVIVPKAAVPATVERFSARREARRPWSPVNNCTPGTPAPGSTDCDRLFAEPVTRHRKRGRWVNWSALHEQRRSERHDGRRH